MSGQNRGPSGQRFVAAECARLLADTAASAPRTLPPLWPPPLRSIWFVHAHGLSWPAASSEPLSAVPYAEEDLAPNPQTQPSCQEVDGCGLKPLSPASFPAFFSSSTPCLAAQSWAWLYHRITHKKASLSRRFVCQMELYHTVLIGCN